MWLKKEHAFMALFLLGGFALGQIVTLKTPQSIALDFQEKHQGEFEFVNPLLQCDIGEELLTAAVRPFKTAVEDLITELKAQNKLTEAAVYFRDLNNGPWFGINEKEEFSPASLLKVPLMMAVLKKSESDPALLKKELLFSGTKEQSVPYFKPSQTLAPNQMYSIGELMQRMIIYSDNDAKALLLETVGEKSLEDVYRQLGIDKSSEGKTDDFITVRNYASFFRILFNASYLNKETSNLALAILNQTKFDQGLVPGIPADVRTSHKFGERIFILENQKQLHDCGIVYFPNRPYLLCVMTRGTNFDRLANAISEISALSYREVKAQFGK